MDWRAFPLLPRTLGFSKPELVLGRFGVARYPASTTNAFPFSFLEALSYADEQSWTLTCSEHESLT